ncbi:MarR family winged helix-turn-helix transcriptional regulator [Proteiniphilum sp. X52]|uniref:MarR family winged helix-turn-helix transcriptional regulator n=1 Tax=Proteiniphilum sp. X52 TaxID=2382159 RepID=UPI000F0A07C4|nr:MarR family transcriptional regulator [Proteiniphilum sp. X52]RNC64388.1 MarR family transcriptional regulator [Proteiniphilum sp. X52]
MESICRLKDIYKALYDYEKRFAEETGITINEGALLCCLKDDKPKSANELCDFIGLSGSRVSRIIHTMEEKNFILREIGTSDKRQMIFTLTDTGRKKIREMRKHDIDIHSLLAQWASIVKE